MWLNIIRAPEAPFVPPEWHGERVCAMVVCHSGDRTRRRSRRSAPSASRSSTSCASSRTPRCSPTSTTPSPRAGTTTGRPSTWPSSATASSRRCRALAEECPIPDSQHAVLHVGGALNDREPDDGAVGNRDARYVCGLIGAWEPGEPQADDVPRLAARPRFERVRPFGTGGNYVNFQSADEGEDRIRASYGANYEAVMAVKRAYDPDDVFRWTRAS